MFFGFFKSRAERNFELKGLVRQGSMKIHNFMARLSKQAEEYSVLARRAFNLDDQQQFRQLASGYLQCRETINRWERYLIRLKALELQKMEAEATRDFLSSMNGLVAAILNGVKPQDVVQLQAEMEKAEMHSEQLADSLAGMLGDAVTRLDDPNAISSGFLQHAVGAAAGTTSDELDQKFWEAIEEHKTSVSSTPDASRVSA